MNQVLTIKDLNYKSIFKNLNMEIQENTFNLITGSNKCGKTTLMKILGGIIEANDVCFYLNNDISKLKSLEFSTLFSYVLFNGNFNFNFHNLDQEILFHLDKVDLTPSERKMKYKHLVRMFGFQDKVFNEIQSLSFYEKMKLLVLLSVIRTPKVLLLDSILEDLKEEEGLELIQILKKIGGMTVILSSSNLNFAMEFDYLYILDQSKIVLSGDPLSVLKEDSSLNKMGLVLPFMVDLSLKLQYYELVDDVILDMNRMVNKLWK